MSSQFRHYKILVRLLQVRVPRQTARSGQKRAMAMRVGEDELQKLRQDFRDRGIAWAEFHLQREGVWRGEKRNEVLKLIGQERRRQALQLAALSALIGAATGAVMDRLFSAVGG